MSKWGVTIRESPGVIQTMRRLQQSTHGSNNTASFIEEDPVKVMVMRRNTTVGPPKGISAHHV